MPHSKTASSELHAVYTGQKIGKENWRSNEKVSRNRTAKEADAKRIEMRHA